MIRKAFLTLVVAILLSCSQGKKNSETAYVCPPCNLSCDTIVFRAPGTCPHCKMTLIPMDELSKTSALVLNEVVLETGSGSFLIEGGFEKEKTIGVHYYRPENFSVTSPVVLVIPGSGRDGDEYRDAWIKKAEHYGVLVLSPEYSEKHYPEFWSYNLAGMISDVQLNPERTAMTGFTINNDSRTWLFNDFDRIFDLVKNKLRLQTQSYDLFGHSAGGQLLHRFAIFNPDNKANRILAANSGWYTVPTDEKDFPVGLKGSKQSANSVDFSSKLVLFLGERDNANETRGDLRHTPELDAQGLHRLARGKHFYNASKERAATLQKEFYWKLEIIPNVGHDFRKMSEAAADFLYASHSSPE
ncbi:MAG: heavy metal-binding domain-containing protein [Bacteroidota bacterium]